MNKFHIEIKYRGYIHTQTALDFKLNLEVITRNDIFQKKFSVTQQKSYDPPTHPETFIAVRNKNDQTPHFSGVR